MQVLMRRKKSQMRNSAGMMTIVDIFYLHVVCTGDSESTEFAVVFVVAVTLVQIVPVFIRCQQFGDT